MADGVSGCLSHNQGTFDLTALQSPTAERKEADFKSTSLTDSGSSLDHFPVFKFRVLTLGPPGVESPTKEKRPHAAAAHAGIILARVALNSSLPPQLAMLFEARAACLWFGIREKGSEGERMGLMKRAGCTLCEEEIGGSSLFLATTLHAVTQLLED